MVLLHLRLDDLLLDCPQAHAGEEDDEDGDHYHRDESPRGRSVLGLAVVPHQLGGREEVQHPDPP